MNKSRACTIALVVVALLSVAAHAQQQPPASLPPTGLALEIVYLKGQPPSLYEVARTQATRPSGGWSGRFGKVAGWKLPGGNLPVFAVQVSSRLEGGLVKIWVAVLLGQGHIEREEPVVTYESHEGEKLVVTELTKFGVEPIEIKVVKAAPSIAILPRIVNKTQSLMVTGIAPNNATLPAYKLSLQNISDKGVVEIEFAILIGGKQEMNGGRRGVEGRPFIAPGGAFDYNISASYQYPHGANAPQPDLLQGHDLVLRAILFSDGSYEGEPDVAARMKTGLRGRKIQFSRIVALLQGALNSADDASATLRRLKAEMSALKTDVEASEIDAILGKLPDLPPDTKTRLNSTMGASLNSMKKTARDELDEFEKSQGATVDKAAFRSWLLATKEKYDQWLSRLNP